MNRWQSTFKFAIAGLAGLIGFSLTSSRYVTAAERNTTDPVIGIQKPGLIPNPIVAFTGKEDYQTPDGQKWTRYKLAVKNYQAFPAAMFAPAPQLPPCGANKNSSRTWVNIYYRTLKTPQPQYIYGFCAFSSPQDLLGLWFAEPQGQHPPTPVYVVLEDRAANKQYASNPVDIPAPAPTKPGEPK